jgi:hypothetical protein
MRNALLLLMLFALLSCGKDNGPRIPEVYVNYPLTIQEFNIKSENGIMLVDKQGVAGLMIVRISSNSYKAFDRCSSVDPEKKCVVVPESTFTASDPCSGGKWLLQDGSPVKAPAVRNLKEYQVRIINSFNLLVTNDYGN